MPHVNSASIIVSGKIKVSSCKKWKQRFCVVARTTFGATLKLFLYKEAADYKKSIDLSAQVPSETIYGLDSVSNSDKSPVMASIVLTCEDRLILLGFTSYTDLIFWVEKIRRSVPDASYRAKFIKCESIGKPIQQQLSPPSCDSGGGFGCSSGAVSGEGRLHVQPSRLCFYSEPVDSHRSLAVWPLQSVKRYMVNEALGCFVFEGDVGCGSLRGMQFFQCDRRHELYADMKAACLNKPLPSLASSDPGAAAHAPYANAAAAFADDPRRPAASNSIDIPKPRSVGQQQSSVSSRHRHDEDSEQDDERREPSRRHCRRNCPAGSKPSGPCGCVCHRRATDAEGDGAEMASAHGQLAVQADGPKRQQPRSVRTADSGYEGGTLASYYNMLVLPQRLLLSGAASREYCNLPVSAGSAPQSDLAFQQQQHLAFPRKIKAATLTPQCAAPSAESRSLLAGISRSLTWRRRQNSHQAERQQQQRLSRPSLDPTSLVVAADSNHGRLVRSSSDLCHGVGELVVVGPAGSACGCCDAAVGYDCDRGSDEVDNPDDGECGSCDCSSCSACDSWTSAGPLAAPAATAALEVRMRKPRHGSEYVSRQRVVSLSSSSSGCYANLPLASAAPLADLGEEPQLPATAAVPLNPSRSAPASAVASGSALHYARLDHSAAAPVLALAAVPARLNYTEVDHSKTDAFREIAELRSDSRRQQLASLTGRSNSTSGPAAGPRRSFIRIFQRGSSFRQD